MAGAASPTGVATSSWAGWFADLATLPGSAIGALAGSDVSFPTAEGLIVVREEPRQPKAQLGGVTSRAHCATSGRDFDLRRLSIGAAEGGFITLTALQVLERTVELQQAAGSHSHVHRCYAQVLENTGKAHRRLLLCEASNNDLAAFLAAQGGRLDTKDAAGFGQQLAFGLDHVHSRGILLGGLEAEGVFRGQDGLWKLADFSRSTRLPISVADWLEQCGAPQHDEAAGNSRRGPTERFPPEVAAVGDGALRQEMDVWFLGQLLAGILLEGGSMGCIPAAALGAVSGEALLCPVFARLWLLLHWLLSDEPQERPQANEVAALTGALADLLPSELLEEMPCSGRLRINGVVRAAARQLAMDEAVASIPSPAARSAAIHRVASLPLAVVRDELADSTRLDTLCRNCGFDLAIDAGIEAPKHCLRDASTDAGSASSSGEATSDVTSVPGISGGSSKSNQRQPQQGPGEVAAVVNGFHLEEGQGPIATAPTKAAADLENLIDLDVM